MQIRHRPGAVLDAPVLIDRYCWVIPIGLVLLGTATVINLEGLALTA